MSMFRDPDDEEQLCQVLRAFTEEWGPEHVIVSVPRHWRDYGKRSLGRVRLEFTTHHSICIDVEYEAVRLHFIKYLNEAA